jgi:hypothetical protein
VKLRDTDISRSRYQQEIRKEKREERKQENELLSMQYQPVGVIFEQDELGTSHIGPKEISVPSETFGINTILLQENQVFKRDRIFTFEPPSTSQENAIDYVGPIRINPRAEDIILIPDTILVLIHFPTFYYIRETYQGSWDTLLDTIIGAIETTVVHSDPAVLQPIFLDYDHINITRINRIDNNVQEYFINTVYNTANYQSETGIQRATTTAFYHVDPANFEYLPNQPQTPTLILGIGITALYYDNPEYFGISHFANWVLTLQLRHRRRPETISYLLPLFGPWPEIDYLRTRPGYIFDI